VQFEENMAMIAEGRDEIADLASGLKAAGLSMNNEAGVLTKASRTTSFQSTAAPISSAASVCSEAAKSLGPCDWQSKSLRNCLKKEAVWTLDIPVRGPDLESASEQYQTWVQQTEECSEVAFDENAMEMISKKSKFKLAILSAPNGDFLGFAIYKMNRGQGSLTIGKIAVSLDYRGQGYGKRMIKELIKMAKKDKMIYFVSLSALPTAVKFYKRMNFKAFTDVKFTEVLEGLREGESFVDGQVYMEFKVRNQPRKGRK
jgi:ribosomal protein S18 acetylase RimI-like enzyme